MTRITNQDLTNVKKFPWQWAVLILVGTVSFIFGLYELRVREADETCEVRINNYSKAIARKDSTIADWQTRYINLSNELLYKNNIIDRYQRVINNTDSNVRQKLEKPAKQILQLK